MSSSSSKKPAKGGKKVRVQFRRNRSTRRRQTDWTQQAREAEGHEIDAERSERVVAKGSLSRRRTVTIRDEGGELPVGLRRGTVIAMRGLYAEVDEDGHVWTCTVRRVLRTRLINERQPVTVGDRVCFRTGETFRSIKTEASKPTQHGERSSREGVIESVGPRQGQLRRKVRRRVHTIVANVDQAIIVNSADQPPPKPHLIDRYIVATLAGDITPVICINKVDLDLDGSAGELLERYARLGYATIHASAITGEGVDTLRDVLKDKASVIAGQSGVGKSALLNAVEPGLRLRTGDVSEQTRKGRHTTTTATLIRLATGGYVVDTPGVRSFDLSFVGRHEFESYFVEFLDHVPSCKFPDCTHTHEDNCAVKQAVERGEIQPERYESYVRLFCE